MGRATISPILLLAFPDKYGVWNEISQQGLVRLGLRSRFQDGASLGGRYVAVNHVLVALRDRLDIDLWTLDGLFWRLAGHET